MTRPRPFLSAGGGVLLAVLFTASPLTVCAALGGFMLWRAVGRDLPRDERRALQALIAAALLARVGLVVLIFLSGLPRLNDLGVGALSGDEVYYLSRAIRARDILLGFADGKYDFFITTDNYGRTSYVALLTWMQVAFGPTPYSMRLVNAVLFVGGALLLFRQVRHALGPLPAWLGLAVLLFLPSLFVSSVSLLKESLYFFVSSLLLVCASRVMRPARGIVLALALPGLAGCLWLLNDLRRGALVLAVSGLAVGLLIWAAGGHAKRLAAAAVLAMTAIIAVAMQPGLHARAIDAVESVAKTHAGHVFTVGHGYKLLDPGFYVRPETPMAWDLQLTDGQALRFLARATLSFFVTPWPWELVSRSEVLFLPEHLVWYVMVLLLPVGIAAGWRRDPLTTSLLLGLAIPTAAAVALTNGNVGTLLRLRGVITPYVIWLSAAGLCAIGDALARTAVARTGTLTPERAME